MLWLGIYAATIGSGAGNKATMLVIVILFMDADGRLCCGVLRKVLRWRACDARCVAGTSRVGDL